MNRSKEIIVALFNATDLCNWEEVQRCFDKEVLLDYSSMSGQPATLMSPEAITDSWKAILPGFDHTHHQLGNFRVSESPDSAQVSCYGTASHYLEDPSGNLWTVVGTYDFELKKSTDGTWVIHAMKFNFKFQDGNTDLPAKAMSAVD